MNPALLGWVWLGLAVLVFAKDDHTAAELYATLASANVWLAASAIISRLEKR